MRNYANYALGKWTKGEDKGTPLFNAISGKVKEQNSIKNYLKNAKL